VKLGRHHLLEHLVKNELPLDADESSTTIVKGIGAGLIVVKERHRPFVDTLSTPRSTSFDCERDHGLLDWWLTYSWFTALFSAFDFKPIGSGQLVRITNPAEFARTHADAAMVMLERGDGAIIAELGASVVEANRALDVGPPP
jgi:hypothetical protein